MDVEIITIGTELLLGQIIDTNSAYLGQNLAELGINVYRKTSIGDNELRLETCLREALDRSDLVIATGGLGPTVDDITKKVACKIFNKKLILNKRILLKVKNIFRERNLKMPESNISQSMIPENTFVIENKTGTAPGLIFKKNKKILILLPGVPKEMKLMFEIEVIPYLKKVFPIKSIILSKTLKVFGLSESAVDEKIKDLFIKLNNPTIALLASMLEIKIRLTAKAENKKDALNLILKVEKQIRERIGDYIFGVNDETIEEIVARLLIENNLTVSVAESCTGGLISNKLTNVPGSSKYFQRGVIVYSNKSKENLLGIPRDVIKKFGVVSKEVSMLMAQNIRKLSKTDIGLSSTGITGPCGATLKKPVGLVYISISTSDKTITKECKFAGERITIKERTATSALDILRRYLLS